MFVWEFFFVTKRASFSFIIIKSFTPIITAIDCIKRWGGPFAIKGVMSVEDAKRAVDIGASAILLSNHGGRQLDGSRSPFDQLPAIVEAVAGKLEIILDGGIRRGTHVLKDMSLGATACSFGKGFLFALGAGGQKGVEQILQRMRDEIRRDMILLGCKSIKELNKTKIVYRWYKNTSLQK